jgi:branched-chain amino acid transport system permease protein
MTMMSSPESTAATPRPSRFASVLRSEPLGILVFSAVIAALGFVITRQDWLLQGTIALTIASAAIGLGLALGLGGEFLLGIAVIFAVSAYTSAILTTQAGWDYWPAAGVGIVAGIVIGILMSLPGLRVSHFYFGMLGFFLVYLLPAIAAIVGPITGGSDGLVVSLIPTLFGEKLDGTGMFVLAAFALFLSLMFSRNIRVSPLGVHMRRMRDAPLVLGTSGVSVWKVRLATYACGSVLAGLGGAVYGHVTGFIQPLEFGFELTNLILAAVIVGGSRTLIGPVIGVLVLYIVPRVIINVEGYADIVYGVIIVVSVLLFRGGVVNAVRDLVAWIRRKRAPAASLEEPVVETIARSPEALAEVLLRLRPAALGAHELTASGVRKRYGGVQALDFDDEQSVTVRTGEVHLLIGPNGSGKTTLLNALTGLARPDSGTVRFDGDDLAKVSLPAIAKRGLSRSFQTPALPDEVTPIDLFAATLAQQRGVAGWHWVFSTPKAVRTRRETRRLAEEIADAAGLTQAAAEACVGLTSGQRRIVDVVLSLLTPSSIVLLDEPAAGLSDLERRQLAATVRALARGGVGVMVVEHDLELAMSIADRVTLMAAGRPVLSGPTDEVRDSAVVREILIGVES